MVMDFSSISQRFKSRVRDITGLDLGSSSTKAVRLRRDNEGYTVLGAQLLPPLAGIPGVSAEAETIDSLALDARTRARVAALATTGPNAIVKLISFPGPPDENLTDRLTQDLGLENPDAFRMSYRVLVEGRGRTESRILAVALPEADAGPVVTLFATGIPAPYALEISGLAALTAFQQACADVVKTEAVGVLEFGDLMTTLCLLNRESPVLMRRFDFGNRALIARICKQFGVTETIAQSIIKDTSFDISEMVVELLSPLLAQVIVSCDFIERRESCRVAAMYATGGLMASADARKLMESRFNVDIRQWNPFEGLKEASGALAAIEAESAWRFAGAVGAALGTLEDA